MRSLFCCFVFQKGQKALVGELPGYTSCCSVYVYFIYLKKKTKKKKGLRVSSWLFLPAGARSRYMTERGTTPDAAAAAAAAAI